MSLFDRLGLDPNDFSWEDFAACNNMAEDFINWFFDDFEQDVIVAANASEICYHCPVISSCFAWAEENKAEGLHGGAYFTNGSVDRVKNKYKTEEEWKRLEKLIGRVFK